MRGRQGSRDLCKSVFYNAHMVSVLTPGGVLVAVAGRGGGEEGAEMTKH
jgi:hypothetical protein